MCKVTGRKARDLRSQGHRLKPAVMVGAAGLSEAVISAVEVAFEDRELIKVKLLDAEGMDRKQFGQELAQATRSQLAQVLGKTYLLYREKKEEA